jgi:alpha-glucosidase (family GH31 glycosyl hydrolase)
MTNPEEQDYWKERLEYYKQNMFLGIKIDNDKFIEACKKNLLRDPSLS